MRNFTKIIFLSAFLFAGYGCVLIEEDGPQKQEFVQMNFKATIEDNLTKTALDGDVTDQHRDLFWLPGDEIAIFNGYDRFVNVNEEQSKIADFYGQAVWDETYYAVYPYDAKIAWETGDGLLRAYVNVPQSQPYAVNTFASNLNPMVARAPRGETLNFRNLCGLLVVNLKGEEMVKTITLATYDEAGNIAQIAGAYGVDITQDEPTLTISQKYGAQRSYSISMDCGDGVQLDSTEPTPFHFILPPGTYSKILLYVTTVDGNVMVKEGKNPLTINRAEWITAGTLGYAESVDVDLSERGNSNCYIVSEPGLYSFDATVIGNGRFGLVENATFHTESTEISPVTAEVLWEDKTGVTLSPSCVNGRINFYSTGIEGNAVIAARDASGKIVWSWHIWSTDKPAEHVYVNQTGTYTVLDRNLGATRADRGEGDQWKEAQGLAYQWGRKDPFTKDSYQKSYSCVPIKETIENPRVVFGMESYNWMDTSVETCLWTPLKKTIYDPCPIGYKVAYDDVWRGFSKTGENVWGLENINATGSFENGWDFIYDGTNTAYYPFTWFIHSHGWTEETNYSPMWSSRFNNDVYAKKFEFNLDAWLFIDSESSPITSGQIVRCVKDDEYVDISYPVLEIKSINNITSNSANVITELISDGISSVTEQGIIYGTSPDVTLDNATKVTYDGNGVGEYAINLSGLSHSTRYYVRAYAINERGVGYSNEKAFYTPYSGDAYDLSANGTANCYIVPPIYSVYSFDATVMGNGIPMVGTPVEAVVLWETRNDRNTVNVGEIVESVSLEDGKVKFLLPFDPQQGNALIAVKDASGTILWSWHLWVVDYKPAETQQTLSSGAIIMDRNLGALGIEPGSEESYGFSYQWGRKDPFMRPAFQTAPASIMLYEYEPSKQYDISEAVQRPYVLFEDASWNGDTKLWGQTKTMHDPCPYGWRVSSKNAWTNLRRADNSQYGYFQLSPDSADPTVYITTAGGTVGDFNFFEVGNWAYLWMCERSCAVEFYVWNWSPSINSSNGTDDLKSIRCMKDIEPVGGGANEGYTGSDYEW